MDRFLFRPLAALLLLFLALPAASARTQSAVWPTGAPAWGPREVRHLLNRAAFGGRPGEIDGWVERGRAALLDELFDPPKVEPYYVERIEPYDRGRLRGLNGDARRRKISDLREQDRRQGRDYLAWWVEQMADGPAPLRERMVLFWHGLFTSGLKTVKRAYPLIEQSQLYRDHALGSYAELLRAVLRDPAMLRYLDGDSNTRRQPNENLGREVMELFSLGEGNYTEDDVRAAARALSGHGLKAGRYHFDPREHDYGQKEILGREGRLDLDDLVDVLLQQDACARWIAGRLIEHFEGVAPSAERVEHYADALRAADYRVAPVLRELFEDPAFYRDEVVGARVASPIDFLVGACVRLRMPVAPRFVVEGASIAGMRLFEPPNVKGWEGGLAWIDSGTLMTRGNLAGLLVGSLGLADLELDENEMEALDESGTYVLDRPDEALMGDDSGEEAMMGGAESGLDDDPLTDEDLLSDGEFGSEEELESDEAMMGADVMMSGELSMFEGAEGERDGARADGEAHQEAPATNGDRAKAAATRGEIVERFDDVTELGSSALGAEAAEDGVTMTDAGVLPPPTQTRKRAKSDLQKLAANLARFGYRPRLHLTRQMMRVGAESDAELAHAMVDMLLAIEPPAETYRLAERYLAAQRELAELEDGELLESRAASEPALRRLAHLILSLPEAQLH